MITSRLPLALPPYAADPLIYAIGIKQFAQLYFTFESLWHDLRQVAAHERENNDMSKYYLTKAEHRMDSSNRPGPTFHMLSFLSGLLPVELERSQRLRSDLSALKKFATYKSDTEYLNSSFPITELYVIRIRDRFRHKPHILIAYAWLMYMAIFSGGRWIRAQLLSVGEDFWLTGDSGGGSQVEVKESQKSKESYLRESIHGLLFFSFDGSDDGELLKATFKARLLEAEHILSVEERADVIEEAREIFKFNIALVKELDNVVISSENKHSSNRHLKNIFITARRFIKHANYLLARHELRISIAIIVTLVGVIWHMHP